MRDGNPETLSLSLAHDERPERATDTSGRYLACRPPGNAPSYFEDAGQPSAVQPR